MTFRTTLIAAGLLFIAGCNNEKTSSASPIAEPTPEKEYSNSAINFKSLSPELSNVHFKNEIKESASRNQNHYDYFYNGSGVAIADFDNDGLSDLFFCGNDSPNAIYKNLGNLKFEDKTSGALTVSSKWAMGVSIVDINNDSYPDIYVCNSGPDKQAGKLKNELFINNKDFTFTESAVQYGLDIDGQSVQAAFFDYDKDGDLDVWVNGHGKVQEINALIPTTKPADGGDAI